MSKHTPGPWKAGRADMATVVDGVDSKWVYAGDLYVAVASGYAGEWDVVMANARLIAAAPDLLEALKQCAAVVAGETMHKGGLVAALEAARAAIAKAEAA